MEYPENMTQAVEGVLRQMCFEFIDLSQLWRDTGTSIARSAEAEQAYFMHLHLKLALKHGNGWRSEFAKLVQERLDIKRSAA